MGESDRDAQSQEDARAESPDEALKRAMEEVREDRRTMHHTALLAR